MQIETLIRLTRGMGKKAEPDIKFEAISVGPVHHSLGACARYRRKWIRLCKSSEP